MNETKHTPEPWERSADNTSNYLEQVIAKSPRGKAIVIARIPRPRIGCPTSNANRIVACVNALANVSDPEQAIKDARDALEATQRHLEREGMHESQLFDQCEQARIKLGGTQ